MHARIGWQNLRTSEFLDSGNYMLITGTDFNDGAINFSTCHYVERERYEQDRNIQIHNGSILITKDGTLGKVAYVQGLSMPATLNAGVFNVQIKDANNVDEKYLFQYLKAPFLMDYVDKKATGGTIKHLNQSILVDFPVILPQRSEQTLIGAFFQQLDNLITLHQRQPFLHSTPEISLTVQLIHPFYTSSWEQRKAIDIADYSKGNGYSKGDLTDAGTPIILYGRLYTKYQFAINEVDTFAVPRNGAVYSQGNEVIVPASGETAEDIARASAVEKSGVLLGGDLNILRPFDFINPLFLALAISNGEPQKELAKKAQGKSVVHIHNSDIQEVTIAYPSRTEQDRIVSYFSQLDSLITLHQRKFEKLTNVKKSMLEKMFPQNGSSYPEIRFKGFTDPWEQRKVGDLLIERNQQAPMSDEYPLMAFIANEGVAPKGERYDRSALVTDTVNKLYKKTEKGDFIYSSNNLETGSIGLNKYGKACISPVYSIFEPTGIADSDFLGRRLVRKDFINAMVKWRQGVIYGQWRIHESDFLKIEIPVPSVEEQRKIGAYLDQLDNLITLHQRELEKLQNIKKSMLEKMFV